MSEELNKAIRLHKKTLDLLQKAHNLMIESNDPGDNEEGKRLFKEATLCAKKAAELIVKVPKEELETLNLMPEE